MTPHESGDKPDGEQRKLLPVVTGYVVAILIGLALPVLAVSLYFALAVFLVTPWRELRLLLRH